jgi:hypothetical protein
MNELFTNQLSSTGITTDQICASLLEADPETLVRTKRFTVIPTSARRLTPAMLDVRRIPDTNYCVALFWSDAKAFVIPTEVSTGEREEARVYQTESFDDWSPLLSTYPELHAKREHELVHSH